MQKSSMNHKKPTLLLDKHKCLNNIRRMQAKADAHGLIFRPHFKTHQSSVVGEWFRAMGIHKITVSSVSMANYFARHGWTDITIAFPLNPAEIKDINILANKIHLNVLVENKEAVNFLSKNLTQPVGVFIKIDAGYHRTGIDVDNHKVILDLIIKTKKNPLLTFAGFIVHNGHSYHAADTKAILAIHDQSIDKLNHLRHFMQQHAIEAICSIGDTPALSQSNNLEGIDEIRPGNFVFYDVMQHRLGSCSVDDIAVALACPMVAKHASRNEMVIYGGAIHLSKEYLNESPGKKNFGSIVELSDKGWGRPVEGCYVKSLSQEHGVIHAPDDFFNKIHVGQFIGILPIHSCLAVAAMRQMYLPDGTVIPAPASWE